jgi:hypothetical protein
MSLDPSNAGAKNSTPPIDASLNDEAWTIQIMSMVNDCQKGDETERSQNEPSLSQARDGPEEVSDMALDVAGRDTAKGVGTSHAAGGTAAGLENHSQAPVENENDEMMLDTPATHVGLGKTSQVIFRSNR